MPNIAILYNSVPAHPMVLAERHIEMIREHNDRGEVRWYHSEEDMLADEFDAEVLLCWGMDTPDRAFKKMQSIKWVQSLSAGYEGLARIDDLKERKAILSKIKGVHGFVMAETCLAFILCFVRSFPLIVSRQKQHVWKKPELYQLRECRDITVGIIGMGDIGSNVAKLCKSLEMRVIGCKRRVCEMENVDKMYSLDDMSEMLPQCDFVVDLVPNTPESVGMIDEKIFRMMKPEGVFINIGRGKTVKTEDLVQALQNGVIAGAALDAIDPEPLNEDSPLWDMENVFITPHCSADSPNYFDRAIGVVAANLDSYIKGNGVPTEVRL